MLGSLFALVVLAALSPDHPDGANDVVYCENLRVAARASAPSSAEYARLFNLLNDRKCALGALMAPRNPRVSPVRVTSLEVRSRNWMGRIGSPPAPPDVKIDPRVQDVIVIGTVEDGLPTCDEEGGGWIGLGDSNGPDPDRHIAFDGSPPASRTSSAHEVPKLGEVLIFSERHPADLFQRRFACLSDDVCSGKPVSGTFQVMKRVWFQAGPQGLLRWQLCVRPLRSLG
jgi:hypothetical protein